MPFSLYDQLQLPCGFIYPAKLIQISRADVFDVNYPWWFVDAASQTGKLFARHVKESNLVPFAKTDLYDDIAFFDGSEKSGNPKIVMVCSAPKRSYSYPDFQS
jgi:hypothetical protein